MDDTLPGIETAVMREHLAVCAGCARQDATLRRSLFLVRNLPRIEMSEGFSDRLRNRLAVEAARPLHADLAFRGPSLRTFAGLASGVLLAGVLSLAAVTDRDPTVASHPRLPAVVVEDGPAAATLDDTGYAAPAFVASMSMGMPVWPTLLLAEQGSLKFAELKPASLQLSPQH